MVVTTPLTDNEDWHIIERGTLLRFSDGKPALSLPTRALSDSCCRGRLRIERNTEPDA